MLDIGSAVQAEGLRFKPRHGQEHHMPIYQSILTVFNEFVSCFSYMFGFHDIERKRYLQNVEEDTIARIILNVGEKAIYNKEVFYVNFTK